MTEPRPIHLPDRPLRLAFFGTPDIAATVLAGLLDASEDRVELVISQPDRPKGRGRKAEPTPTHALAREHGLEVTQPTRLKDGALAAELTRRQIDLAIVVAYGRILPTDLFLAPTYGSWNVHASLLPRWRGAAPVQHAILAGDDETGVTLMALSEGMDEGDILLKKTCPLDGTETTETLMARLAALGATAVRDGLAQARRPEGLPREPQDHAAATYAPMIQKAHGAIDWHRDAASLARMVRAYSPWPSAYVRTPDGPLRILEATAEDAPEDAAPGTVRSLTPLTVQTGSGALSIARLQPPGRRALLAADYLRGQGRTLAVGAPLAPTAEST